MRMAVMDSIVPVRGKNRDDGSGILEYKVC